MPAQIENAHQYRFREERLAKATRRLAPPRTELRQAGERQAELAAFQTRLTAEPAFSVSTQDYFLNRRRFVLFCVLTFVGFNYDAMFTFANIASYLGADLARLLGISALIAARVSAFLFSFTLLAATIAIKSITESYAERARLNVVPYDDVESLQLTRAVRWKFVVRAVWVAVLGGIVVVGWQFEVRRGHMLDTGVATTGISSRELAYLMAYVVTSVIHTILLWFPVRLERTESGAPPCAPAAVPREVARVERAATESANQIYDIISSAPQDIQPRLVSLLTRHERAAVNRAMGSNVFGDTGDNPPPAPPTPPPNEPDAPAAEAVGATSRPLDGVL